MCGETDGGSGIALHGLGQNLALGNFGQLLDDLGAQVIVGENPDALGRQHGAQAVDCLLDESAFAEEFQDLLGAGAAAAGPKAGASATGQDQAIIVRHNYWIGIPRTSFRVRFQRVLVKKFFARSTIVAAAVAGPFFGGGVIGPEDHQRLADDVLARHETPIAAVERILAVVAHGEVVVGGHHQFAVAHVGREHLLGAVDYGAVGLRREVVAVGLDVLNRCAGCRVL